MSTQEQASSSNRKRGRPSGRNRVPLTLEERRARNAQYERERREATAEATRELAEAAGLPTDISTEELIRRVILYLQRDATGSKESITDLRRINKKLNVQIVSIERQLDQVHISKPQPKVIPESTPAPAPSRRSSVDLELLSTQEEQFLQDLVGPGLLEGVDPSELEF